MESLYVFGCFLRVIQALQMMAVGCDTAGSEPLTLYHDSYSAKHIFLGGFLTLLTASIIPSVSGLCHGRRAVESRAEHDVVVGR